MAGAERIAAGLDYIFYGVLNSSGYMYGSTSDGATSGAAAGEPMLRLDGGRTVPVSLPEDEIVTVVGDNAPMVSFNFPPTELPNGVIELSERNDVFDALVQGLLVETLGDMRVSTYGTPDRSNQPDMCLLMMQKAKKWEAGVQGIKAWEMTLVPRCTITPLGNDITQREFGPYRYSVNLQTTDRKSWGATFTDAINATESGTLIKIASDNPIMLQAFVGNGAAQAFTLAYTPVSAAKLFVHTDGVLQTNPADYGLVGTTVTFTGTPDDGAVINALYEIAASALS
jgi:hypothetical protein